MTRFSSRKFEDLTLQEASSPRSHVVPLNVELQLNTGMDRQGCLMQMPSWKITFYEMPWLIFSDVSLKARFLDLKLYDQAYILICLIMHYLHLKLCTKWQIYTLNHNKEIDNYNLLGKMYFLTPLQAFSCQNY